MSVKAGRLTDLDMKPPWRTARRKPTMETRDRPGQNAEAIHHTHAPRTPDHKTLGRHGRDYETAYQTFRFQTTGFHRQIAESAGPGVMYLSKCELIHREYTI